MANGLVIVTLDKDFGRIYHFSTKACGTIVIRLAEPTVEKVNSALEALLQRLEPGRLQKSLVIMSDAGYRIIEK